MTDDRSSDLLSALPRSRPHRRSAKRPARPVATPENEAQQAPERPRPATTRSSRAKGAGAKTTGAKSSKQAKPATSAAKTGPKAGARTSPKRASKPAPTAVKSRSKRLAQPAQPRGIPTAAPGPRPEPSTEIPVLRTAVQAAAELTEIGVTLSTRALRRALGRLPRP